MGAVHTAQLASGRASTVRGLKPRTMSQATVYHDVASVVGEGCDDQFEFAPDLLLDGLDRLR